MLPMRPFGRPQPDFSFIGSGVRLAGVLRFSGRALLEGAFQGEIEGDGHLRVSAGGEIEGDVHAREFVSAGRTKGFVHVQEVAELHAGCHHRGDVTARKVRISPQARFEGKLAMPEAVRVAAPRPGPLRRRAPVAAGVALLLAAGVATTALSREFPVDFRKVWERLDAIWEARVGEWLVSGEREDPGLVPEELQNMYLSEAARHESRGELDKAAARLRKALALEGSRRSVVRYRLAKVLARQNRSPEAIREIHALLEATPGHIEAMILLGDIYVRAGRLSEARGVYREAFLREPEDMVLKRRLRAVEARIDSARPKAPDAAKPAPPPARVLIDAENLLSRKRPAQAVELLEGAIKRAPENARLHFLLGAALVAMGRTNAAIRAYKKVVALSPDWLDGYVRLGALLESRRRDREAIALYRKASKLDANPIEMRIRIARLHKARGRRNSARKILNELLTQYPRSSLVLVELGVLLWESGKAEESKKVFTQVLDIDKNSAPALNRLAWFHATEKKELERGIRLSKRSLEVAPDTPAYLDTLAELYHRSGQSVKAIPLIQRAIELEPGNRYFRIQLGKFKRASRK